MWVQFVHFWNRLRLTEKKWLCQIDWVRVRFGYPPDQLVYRNYFKGATLISQWILPHRIKELIKSSKNEQIVQRIQDKMAERHTFTLLFDVRLLNGACKWIEKVENYFMLANNFKINNSELSFLHNIMHQPCAPVSNKTKCIHFKPLFS